ncbi:MAG TPA: bifunctional tetrahydrofolate synthase/dihydrofolate synthase [Xanthomonadales bacterium]|nr:bifunctional tetrahydrofolate synthase/dihydrofolate synthase [Xanthomonadales bacterium]
MHLPLSSWLERIQENHPDKIELGLERCADVWNRMGCPRPAPKTFTVAGTNGKGSTIAGIESALLHLGRRVGCYTSPHLLRFEERVRVNGQDSDEKSIIQGFEAVETARENTRLTYFEFVTLAAIWTLYQARLDVAILEVGLGGRLDAVNIIDADVAVITAIGIDHQEFLGNDRESIGYEKSGIMRSGQTVICSDRQPPDSVFTVANDLNARLIRIGADFEVSRDISPGPDHWNYYFADESVDFPVPARTPHLAENLAGALTAVITSEAGLQDQLQALANVVASSRVRGRLEQVGSKPQIILDVGHNPLAAEAIREFLIPRQKLNCIAVLAMLRDKDAEGVVSILDNVVTRWHCAGLSGSRGQSGPDLEKRVRTVLPDAELESHQDVSAAIRTAMAEAGVDDTILIFGSFLTVEQATRYFQNVE